MVTWQPCGPEEERGDFPTALSDGSSQGVPLDATTPPISTFLQKKTYFTVAITTSECGPIEIVLGRCSDFSFSLCG